MEDELGATEERNLAPCLVPNGGVPDVRRAPEVGGSRLAPEDAFARGAQEAHLQLERREAARALRKVREAAVAGRGVGQCDERACMDIAVWRKVVLAKGELGSNHAVLEPGHLDPELTG